MDITALAGGVGGARFLRGLRAHLDATGAGANTRLTVVGNTGDDITLFGLRVCPDLDTLLYTFGGGVDEEAGWGRLDDTGVVQSELAAYGAQPHWFALGDRDFATHIARSQWLGQGASLSQVTSRLADRWGLPGKGIHVLPMSDEPVETHVVVDDEKGLRAVHFQEWWVRMRAAVPAVRFTAVGMDRARPAPGVLEAIRDADVVLLPPSNPVVSIGIILAVPGIRDALRGTNAPVVGVSPVVDGRPVRGHLDACLATLGLPCTSQAVAGLYADFLDGWLVDPADADTTLGAPVLDATIRTRPLLMTDVGAAAAIAGDALDLARTLAASGA